MRAYSADFFSKKIKSNPERYPQFEVSNGLIYRIGSDEGKRLYIPVNARVEMSDESDIMQLRTYLIFEYHDTPHVGHVGQKRTLSMLQRYFWWENMSREVARHVRECPVCQRIKSRKHKPYGRFKAVKPSDKLWEAICIIIYGLDYGFTTRCLYREQ